MLNLHMFSRNCSQIMTWHSVINFTLSLKVLFFVKNQCASSQYLWSEIECLFVHKLCYTFDPLWVVFPCKNARLNFGALRLHPILNLNTHYKRLSDGILTQTLLFSTRSWIVGAVSKLAWMPRLNLRTLDTPHENINTNFLLSFSLLLDKS